MKNITTISGISSKLGTFARIARSKTLLTAAVAATGLGLASNSSTSFGAISDITSITTQFTVGSTTTVTNVTGAGTTNVSPFYPQTNKYTVNYANDVNKVLSVVAGGTTYTATGQANAVVKRSTGANNDTIWEVGTGGKGSSVVNVQGKQVTSLTQAFAGNNTLMGGDNVFSNQGNSVGNNTNVARIDLLFTGGFQAAANKAFSIMDRGPTTDHDVFKIAAITSLDGSGAPSGYGPLITFADGTWGKTNIIGATQEDILRKNNSVVNDPFHPSDTTGQPVGGVLIPTSNLVAAGTTIYGYSLFSGKANGSGTQLVNWTNSTFFPAADSTSTGGGLDPVGTLGVLYTTSVPEPTSAALGVVALAGFIARRPGRSRKVQA